MVSVNFVVEQQHSDQKLERVRAGQNWAGNRNRISSGGRDADQLVHSLVYR